MKRALFIACGLCWLGFAVTIAIISRPYLAGATGDSESIFQIIARLTSGSVLLGLLHLIGIFALIAVCLAIGLNLLLHGIYSAQPKEPDSESKR